MATRRAGVLVGRHNSRSWHSALSTANDAAQRTARPLDGLILRVTILRSRAYPYASAPPGFCSRQRDQDRRRPPRTLWVGRLSPARPRRAGFGYFPGERGSDVLLRWLTTP